MKKKNNYFFNIKFLNDLIDFLKYNKFEYKIKIYLLGNIKEDGFILLSEENLIALIGFVKIVIMCKKDNKKTIKDWVWLNKPVPLEIQYEILKGK